ncbi:hypothetical protein ACFL1H_04160 [Nanoarchaeota archaeon]
MTEKLIQELEEKLSNNLLFKNAYEKIKKYLPKLTNTELGMINELTDNAEKIHYTSTGGIRYYYGSIMDVLGKLYEDKIVDKWKEADAFVYFGKELCDYIKDTADGCGHGYSHMGDLIYYAEQTKKPLFIGYSEGYCFTAPCPELKSLREKSSKGVLEVHYYKVG